jgi:hypothetical protein
LEKVTGTIGVRTVWFWFTPYSGLVSQTEDVIKGQTRGLKLQDIRDDRIAAIRRDGDIYVSTWALVATGRKEARKVRTETDDIPSLDLMLHGLRAKGFFIGAVIDEAHINFGTNAKQAAAFYLDVLQPDFTVLATATPKDTELDAFRKAAKMGDPNRREIDRATVVNAALNKVGVKAVYFRPDVKDEKLFDNEEVAIEAGLRQHERIKEALVAQGIRLNPLLLIQVDDQRSGGPDPIEKVRAFLKRRKIDPSRVAVHTSAEPDPYFHTLAYDETKDVLVFKVAAATGFDAPRAWTLVSLRKTRGVEFGLQILGRIMRVHPRVQPFHGQFPLLDNGYVFLASPEQYTGLTLAAGEIQSFRKEALTVTDAVTVIDFGSHKCAILDPDGGFIEAFVDWAAEPDTSASSPVDNPTVSDPAISTADEAESTIADRAVKHLVALDIGRTTLFDTLPTQTAPGSILKSARDEDADSVALRRQGYIAYPLRTDIQFPRFLAREVMPKSMDKLVEGVASTIDFDDHVMALVQRRSGKVLVTETGMFDSEITRREEKFALSDERIMIGAQLAFSFNDSLDIRLLMPALINRMRQEFDKRDLEIPTDDELARGISLAVMMYPHLLHDASRTCLARAVNILQDEAIPGAYAGPPGLEPAAKNLYGVFPANMNNEEAAFARLLDSDSTGTVEWWLRNSENYSWAVTIVLPNGRRHYPDFVIGVNGRKSLDHIGLAEVKDDAETGRLNSTGNTDKVRTEHSLYGSAIMVTRDPRNKEWYRVEYFPDVRRHQPAAQFKISDFVWIK